MKFVLDCSAGIGMARHLDEALPCRYALAEGPREVLAPTLLYAEAGSTMAKHVKAGVYDQETAGRFVDAVVSVPDTFVEIEDLYEEAFFEALHLNHSIYDMFYFVLARRNAATLLTLDKRLNALCEREGVGCIHEAHVPSLEEEPSQDA